MLTYYWLDCEETNLSEIIITFFFKKMHLKLLSAKWPLYSDLDALIMKKISSPFSTNNMTLHKHGWFKFIWINKTNIHSIHYRIWCGRINLGKKNWSNAINRSLIYLDCFMVLTVSRSPSSAILIYLDRFTVPTVSQSQPSAHKLI